MKSISNSKLNYFVGKKLGNSSVGSNSSQSKHETEEIMKIYDSDKEEAG